MKSVWFNPSSEQEMIHAASWYEAQEANLGMRFLTSIQEAVNRIECTPRLFPLLEGDVRRCLVRTFPFGVLFREKPETIEIVAVMHLHREPRYWDDR